ncbi:MAG: preprotein translocase subunit SecG [Clostridiales bacterium]|nr:preprotein translocase subunit SecG [Clostridiales bacterium]MDD7432765.1 preprotein translocase subunit SecG [Clostridiales bacterium]MDY3061367.1 preprotein translocase subunit SecG [Eubacteriales bacterium]
MQALIVILAILDILVCIALVLLVVFQQGNSQGLGSIAGGAETFLGKNKSRSIDDKLKTMTSYCAIAFAVLSVVLYLLTGRG